MPSGTAHARLEIGFLVILAVPAMVLGVIRGWWTETEVAAFAFSYAFSMVFLSPDLDLQDSAASHRWGPLRWLWMPYALAFRHRRASHHPLWGPLGRIVYLGILAAAVGFIVLLVGHRAAPRISLRWTVAVAIVVGVYLPNLLHIAADRLHSAWRRRRRL